MIAGAATLQARFSSRFSFGGGVAAGAVISLLPSRSGHASMVNPPLMILLGVNIDHAATLRQARYRQVEGGFGGLVEPDPVALAGLCEKAGADGITVHLR